MAPTRLSKILLASTVEHPPWDPHPMGNSTGACQPLVMVHNAVLGNNQEEQKKKLNKLVCGSRGKWKKKKVCVFCAKRKMKTKTFCSK